MTKPRAEIPILLRLSLHVMLAMAFVHTCSADLIWIKGNAEPASGRILEQSVDGLKFQKLVSGKFGATETIMKNTIEQFIANIDPKRLEALDPSTPESYRDYAEELSAQQLDPSALALSRRLYLVAAFHSEGMLRMSAIAGLIQLTESEPELRALRMLRFLHDPRKSTTFIPEKEVSAQTLSLQERKQMLQLVRSLRSDKLVQAAKILASENTKILVANWSDWCSFEELLLMTKGNRISKVQLSKLLSIEVELIDPDSNWKPSAMKQQTWSDFAIQKSEQSPLIPSLENVLPINPKKSVYRNSNWIEPK